MKKIRFGLFCLYGIVAVGFTTTSFSEDGNPSQWSMNCFHHGSFIGVSNSLIGCVNQVPEPIQQSTTFPHVHSPATHTNILDCVTADPFN